MKLLYVKSAKIHYYVVHLYHLVTCVTYWHFSTVRLASFNMDIEDVFKKAIQSNKL